MMLVVKEDSSSLVQVHVLHAEGLRSQVISGEKAQEKLIRNIFDQTDKITGLHGTLLTHYKGLYYFSNVVWN